MKQGNSESDQTPDFVCFRKVVYNKDKTQNFVFLKKKFGFSRKNLIFQEKNSHFREQKLDFPKNWIFERKSRIFERKKIGISFPPECFITKLFFEK